MRDECHARDGKRSIVDSSGAHSRPFATSRSRSRSQHVNNRNQTHVDVTVHQEQGTRRCAPHTHMTQPVGGPSTSTSVQRAQSETITCSLYDPTVGTDSHLSSLSRPLPSREREHEPKTASNVLECGA